MVSNVTFGLMTKEPKYFLRMNVIFYLLALLKILDCTRYAWLNARKLKEPSWPSIGKTFMGYWTITFNNRFLLPSSVVLLIS